jgi:8-oxo-dGTP pyrophosphatase MutT (NUDIX family)
VRASTLRHHANEVCFPGGRPDASDVDLRATALREAHEELGIEDAQVLGELSSVPLYTSDFRLHPFVAAVEERPLRVNETEVAHVLRIPLREVLARGFIDAIPWQAGELEGLSPVFELGPHRMYGATAHAFYELLCVVASAFELEAPTLRPGKLCWSDVMPRT